MKLRTLKFATVVSLSVLAAPVSASEFADRIVLWLEEQGFTHFEVKKTWLGRIKIEAYADGIEREIILNGRTGEILRDYWEYDDGGEAATANFLAVPEGMGNSQNVQPVQEVESDEEDDEDEHDDDHEDSKDSEDASDDDEGDEIDEEDEEEEDDDDDEEEDD